MNTSIPSKSKSKSKSTSTSKSEFQSEFEFQTNGSILKLKEKQRELRWILELNEMSEGMSNQVKELSEQILLGSNGLKGIESVVQKFQNVFVYAQKAIATRTESNINSDDPRMMNPSRSQRKNPRGLMEEDLPIDGLVRIPLSDQSDSIEGL